MPKIVLQTSFAEPLQDLVLNNEDVDAFLKDLTVLSAETLSNSTTTVHCGVTLVRDSKSTAVTSSGPEAERLEEVQHGFKEGPCLEAIRTGTTIVIDDARTDLRFRKYLDAAQKLGHYSMLGVPVYLGSGGGAAIDFYAEETGAFTPEIIEEAEHFAAQAAKALQLAVRIATETERSAHLESAMESRTNIDVAVGIIMAQNLCSQNEAISILTRASNAQNVKLREIAERLVNNLAGEAAETHFR